MCVSPSKPKTCQKLLSALVIVVLVLLSGCATSGSYHTVTFGEGHMEVQNGTFIMDGNVSLGTGAQPDVTFRNVSVVLYTADEQVIKTVDAGSLSTKSDVGPLERRVNITTEQVPEYVVIRSSEFWTTDATIRVFGYRRTETGYEEYFRSEKNQTFPD